MFTPVETSVGAVLLWQGTRSLLYQNGNVLGVSGCLRRLFTSPTPETIAFFVGTAASYPVLESFAPQLLHGYPEVPSTLLAALATVGVGVLTGWGTKVINGCTSGHIFSGLSRLSSRSILATAIFFPSALITSHLVHPSITAVCPANTPCWMPTFPSAWTTASLILLAFLSTLSARIIPSMFASSLDLYTSDSKPFPDPPKAAREATQFFAGLLFALGLQVSQMSSSPKVSAFLSFPNLQRWDPSLALVLLLGVGPALIEQRIKGYDQPPTYAQNYSLPTTTLEDTGCKFAWGAAAFGVAWGATGICPGPAVLRALAQPTWGALWMSGFALGNKLPL